LPETLDETYDRILRSIEENHKHEVRTVLQWLAFSDRPVRLREATEVIAVDTQHKDFNPDKRLLDSRELLTMCSTLVTLTETYYYDHDYRKVFIAELRLAHFTVKEYLLSDRLRRTPLRFYNIEEKSANVEMAKICLVYLGLPHFASGYRDHDYISRVLEEWPLLDYAARFCASHVKAIEGDLDPPIRALLQEFFATSTKPNGGNFGTLVGVIWQSSSPELIQATKPLYFAASYGLTSMVRMILNVSTAADIEAKGGRHGSSPLQVASYRGHLETVELLLAAGADPNSKNNLGETSLFWAKKGGFSEIQNLLRLYGARREPESSPIIWC
jgi:hypothetical protein